PTTNECEMRRGVVGRAERRRRKDWMIWIGEAGDAMDRARRDRFVVVERRQQRRQSAGEHRLAGARRSHKKQVVASSRGDLERELSKTERRDVDRELAAGAQYPERDRQVEACAFLATLRGSEIHGHPTQRELVP